MCIFRVGMQLDLNVMCMMLAEGNTEEICCLSSRELRTIGKRGFAQLISHGRWTFEDGVRSHSMLGAQR